MSSPESFWEQMCIEHIGPAQDSSRPHSAFSALSLATFFPESLLQSLWSTSRLHYAVLCHIVLQLPMQIPPWNTPCLLRLVTQLCLPLCDLMDCSPPGSSVYGIFQARNAGVGCHFLLQGIFPTQGLKLRLLCLLHCRQILNPLNHLGSSPSLVKQNPVS